VAWNFSKFLVTRTGRVAKSYAPGRSPLRLQNDIAKALAGTMEALPSRKPNVESRQAVMKKLWPFGHPDEKPL